MSTINFLRSGFDSYLDCVLFIVQDIIIIKKYDRSKYPAYLKVKFKDEENSHSCFNLDSLIFKYSKGLIFTR